MTGTGKEATMDFSHASDAVGRRAGEDGAPTGRAGPSSAHAWQHCANCAVRGVCLPSGMSAGELSALGTIVIGRRRVRKGQVLCREGEKFLFVYAVRVGTFKASAAFRDGTQQIISYYLRGEVMGLDGVAGGVHASTLTAMEEAEVCAVSYAQLSDAMAGLKTLRLRLMQLAGSELLRQRQLLALVANTHTEARVAAFLLQLSQRMQDRGYLAGDSMPDMSRSDLGSYLATTQETVSRCISSFARRGLITVRKRRIRLGNVEKLKHTFEDEIPS